MIIVKIMGGLGNQMQQFAIYQKFLKLGEEAKLDISWFDEKVQAKQLAPRKLELELFENLRYEICTKEEREELTGDNSLWGRAIRRFFPNRFSCFSENGRMYLPEIFELKNAYLEGYFACEKYYADILPLLREQFLFPESGNPNNKELAERIMDEESVSIHIRRGDYLDTSNADLFGGICTEEYYERAVALVKKECPNAKFYIFSDDIAYAKKKYQGGEYTVIDWNHGDDSFYDMYLMSRCRHNICANSTFSFWGARLNPHFGKMMIRPLKHRNNQEYDRKEMERLWQGWILL